jgi:hypothetical protein
MTMTTVDYLNRGYRATEKDLAKARQRELAALFKPDDRCERLLYLKRTDPAAFKAFGASGLLAVGHYTEQKAAYEAEQGETT